MKCFIDNIQLRISIEMYLKLYFGHTSTEFVDFIEMTDTSFMNMCLLEVQGPSSSLSLDRIAVSVFVVFLVELDKY